MMNPRQDINSYIPDSGADWLLQSYHDNSSIVRTLIYHNFKMAQFTPSEIYYILFEK